MTILQIQGPAGMLEATVDRPASDKPQENGSFAVLCHPHPQYGGSMSDAVLATAVEALTAHDYHCLRFNFRGVGSSDGKYDQGHGEAHDVSAICHWVRTQFQPGELLLVGYSFGANAAWRSLAERSTSDAAPQDAAPHTLWMIAPPLGHMPFDGPMPACPIHVFAGTQDAFIDTEALAGFTGQIHRLPGADHFFTGVLPELGERFREVLKGG